MNKNFSKKLFLIFLLALVVFPAVSQAQVTITSIVNNLARIVTGLAVVITVVCWVITGLLFLLAQGDPGKLGKARSAFIWAIVGTAIAILAGSATSIIGGAILGGV